MIKNIKRFITTVNHPGISKFMFISKDKIKPLDNDVFEGEIKKLEYIKYDDNHYDLIKTIRTSFNIDYWDLDNFVYLLNRYYIIADYIKYDNHGYRLILESKY